MSKWIAEFELEDGDRMPEHMDLEYHGVKLDFYCRPLEQEPCEDAVSRAEVLNLVRLNAFHAKSQIKAIENMPSVTPQEPKTGYISIDDAMSVFDDFMCGDADEESTETFLEMLKDKTESEGEE